MNGNKIIRETLALFLLFAVLFIGVSLWSYHPSDPTINHTGGLRVHNLVGTAGSYCAGFLVDFLGMLSFLFPVLLAYLTIALLTPKVRIRWWQSIGLLLLFTCLLSILSHPPVIDYLVLNHVSGGGFLGSLIYELLSGYLRVWGTILVEALFVIFSLQMIFCISWVSAGKRIRSKFIDLFSKYLERADRRKKKRLMVKQAKENELRVDPDTKSAPQKDTSVQPAVKPTPLKKETSRRSPKKDISGSGKFPGLELLAEVPESRAAVDKIFLETMSRQLIECLENFNIKGKVERILPGPVITMFEFKPAPGIKISKIAGLSDDLALSLKALAVRIIAPLPGKDAVGIEIPNHIREVVYLGEVIKSKTFTANKGALPLALGKDIQGQPKVVDMTKMPHLLVAGATGAGKSVCLNTLLVSLLYKIGPDELKLLLVDPKRIELAVYSSLPHLVHPVVTDMALAKNALEWAVYEMEQRYDSMAKLGVRNIASYNQKVQKLALEKNADPELQPFPFLLIVIDELADLMLTAAKEVEVSIVRLAQLARASGIHLILATQRPSVDVVTGIIKANFPSRIAFQVSSKHDSRTILDGVGAEHLLGQGDMLYKPSGGNIIRVHGAYVGDDEIQAVVDFWDSPGKQDYEVNFSEWKNKSAQGNEQDSSGGDSVADEPGYPEAVMFVMEQGKASISLIQRRFRIGFNKAARYIEQMEKDGVIGAQEGSKPRKVLKKK